MNLVLDHMKVVDMCCPNGRKCILGTIGDSGRFFSVLECPHDLNMEICHHSTRDSRYPFISHFHETHHKDWNKITFYQKRKENKMLEQLTFLNGIMIARNDIEEKTAWLGDLLVVIDRGMSVRNFTYERDSETDSSEYK